MAEPAPTAADWDELTRYFETVGKMRTQMVVDLYRSGMTMREVGAVVGHSSAWVRDQLADSGVKRRSQGRRGVRDRDRQLAMVALRAEGVTYQEIGERYGLTRQRVHQLLQRYAWEQGEPQSSA